MTTDAGLPDRVVVVDWSAAARPRAGSDSIWQADLGPDGAMSLSNPTTRAAWADAAASSLGRQVEAGERVLLAIDAGLGFPVGFAGALGLGGGRAGWRSLCRLVEVLVEDGATNANNRFDVAEELNRRCGATGPGSGPFWGHPHGRAYERLGPRRPPSPVVTPGGTVLDEWREVESLARTAGWRIQPVWKLSGAGSVGSQTLLALAWLERLRGEPVLAGHMRVWPQETGPVADPWRGAPGVVVVECWPPASADPSAHAVRDAAQVIGTARHLRGAARWEQVGGRADEEGWIVGLPPAVRPGGA